MDAPRAEGDDPGLPIRRGTGAYRRFALAMVLAAFATFASLYSIQPLLPIFSAEFGIDAARSSLALSSTTATLAAMLMVASIVSDRFGRRRVLVVSILSTSVFGLVLPFVTDWAVLIGIRLAMGITLAGLPAVAMVYLAEELDPEALGPAMGLYIAGTAVGGMLGRVLAGALAAWFGWRVALAVLGVLIMLAAIAFVRLVPRSRPVLRSAMGLRGVLANLGLQLRDRGLPWLFVSSFLLMGSFVTLYNYAGFRLALPPFGLDQAAIALIFVVYLLGSVSSATAGALTGRLGRRRVYWVTVLVMSLGLALTAVPSTIAVIAGLAIVAIGFFAAHGIASAWVARRAVIGRAQASAFYMVMYYLGSSVLGTLGGYAWEGFGWPGVLALTGTSMALALVIALRLTRLPPLPIPERPAPPVPPD